jgi:hypothetical protein
MLDDAAIERWARQVVLPEVGGRGQERLLASRACVSGDGPAARLAADLLERAGVRTGAAPGDVAVDLRLAAGAPSTPAGALVWGRVQGGGRAILVACPAGSTPPAGPRASRTPATTGPLAVCTVHALAALAALEALHLLLVPGGAVRRFEFDLAAGAFAARSEAPAGGGAHA